MPNRNSPKVKAFAQRLLSQETLSGSSAEGDRGDGTATFRICEELRVSLGQLMGAAGYRSLLSRALALAGTEVPWLRGLHIRADGTLEDWAELKSKLNNKQIAQGDVALVAELLGLMVTFIGPTLTLQLMQQAWPEADFSKYRF